MSDHLAKAKAALDRARDHTGARDAVYDELLIIAGVQANVAQAEALERIAAVMEGQHLTALIRTEPR